MSALRIKICGITTAEDALLAAELGAFAVGFIFYPRSPRYLPPAAAAPIIARLPRNVLPVGVFVNAAKEVLFQAVAESGVRAVQLHGDEPPQALDEVRSFAGPGGPLETLRAARPAAPADLKALGRHRPTLGFLIDAAVEGAYGGTGRLSNWQLARAAKALGPVYLSGGLRPDNVAAALSAVEPDGIDVSSGVESQPGRKCPEKLTALFRAVSAAQLATRRDP